MRPLPASCLALAAALLGGTAAAAPGELTLQALVEAARANDLRVKEAEAELSNLRAKSAEAFWSWFPKFETTVALAGPTPEARNDALGGPPTTPASYTWDLDYGKPGFLVRTEINALLPIYTFGKLSALREAGRQGVTAGEGLRARAQDEAAFQAAQTFYGYQLARQGKAALQDALKQLDDASATLKKLLEQQSPQVSKLDEYKLAYWREQVGARAPQAEMGMDLALAAARLLVGKQEPVALAAVDLELPSAELPPVERCLELSREHRPELRAINAGVAAREQEVFIRKRMFLPDLGLLGFFRFQYTSSATRQLSPFAYDPYNDLVGGVALVARMTFDVPVKQAQLDQARAELEKLSTQRALLASAIQLEVRKTHGEVRDALARARSQAEAQRQARRWTTAAYANFELGTSDTRELVDAFTAYSAATGEKLKAWHDASVGLYALSKAVGTQVASAPVSAPARRE